MQVVDWISKQAGKLADNFSNYKFFIKCTPQTIDSSTRLFLNTYTSRDEQAVVPCLYRWSKLKNGIASQVFEFKGNTFICEPSDVGSVIQVQVTSTDQQNPGTALLKFGPVQIDVLLKQTIEGALSTGQAKFQVDIFHENRTKQCTLTITEDFIKIAHCNSSTNFRFNYCLGEPLINGLSKEPTNIAIVFPQKYQNQTIKFLLELWNDVTLSKQQKIAQELIMNLKFVNRRSKDEFLFVMKGFIAKKQLKHSAVITKIEKIEVDGSNINYMLEIQSLRKDLLKLFNENKRVQQQKKIYFQETIKLQQQIEDIISSYTKLIEGKFKTREEFESSFVDFQNRKDQAISHKYKKLQQENNKLKQYIREKLDGEFKGVEYGAHNSMEMRQDSINPFAKKKEPFAQIQPRDSQKRYQNILQNMSVEEEMLIGQTKDYNQVIAEKQKLENKLNRSLMKIQKLQGQLQKLNRSAVIQNYEANLSISRNNTSALQISTSKIVQQKSLIQKKYAKLKQDYIKLKCLYQNLKETVQTSDISNPKFKDNALEIQRMKSALIAMEKEKDSWRQKAQMLGAELRKQKEENERMKAKLQRKIFELNQQVDMSRKNSDVMNRSQHLSMEMDQYNQQQTQILKQQNTFLMSENERLTKMCEKYKTEYKKMKEGLKQNTTIV